MIRTKGLYKEFDKLFAVADLDLHIEKGEIFGLLGPNGAGKTTTIRMLTTLLAPTRGYISIDGVDALRHPGRVRTKIGYVPDFFGMPPGLRAWEYLDYFAAVYRIEQPHRSGRIDETLELVKLTDRKNTFIGSMSRGMKQRLCVAKMLLNDPEILLLDEPTSGLDPESRVDLRRILKLLQQSGKTVLISSHLLVDLTGFCTSLGIMDRGRLLEAGPIETLKTRYKQYRLVRMRVILGIDAIERTLGEDPKVIGVEIEGSDVTVRYTGTLEEMAELNARLNAAGIRISSFTEEEETIEHIFMRVTESKAIV
jgi:ABC-2 type transport system ATP-binding protein